MCLDLCIYLSIYLSIHLPIYLPILLSTYPSTAVFQRVHKFQIDGAESTSRNRERRFQGESGFRISPEGVRRRRTRTDRRARGNEKHCEFLLLAVEIKWWLSTGKGSSRRCLRASDLRGRRARIVACHASYFALQYPKDMEAAGQLLMFASWSQDVFFESFPVPALGHSPCSARCPRSSCCATTTTGSAVLFHSGKEARALHCCSRGHRSRCGTCVIASTPSRTPQSSTVFGCQLLILWKETAPHSKGVLGVAWNQPLASKDELWEFFVFAYQD